MVVLRDSYRDRIGCLEDLEMGRRITGRIHIFGSC